MNKCVKKVFSVTGDFVRHIIYPDQIKCIVCETELGEDSVYGLCDRCELKRNSQYCETCGRYLYSLATYCNDCKSSERGFDVARAPIIMEGQAHSIIHNFKYGNSRWLAPYLTEYMADSLVREMWDVDLVLPVPLHQKRERQRGYNQSVLIAKELSKKRGIEYDWQLLVRKVDTPYLARMSRQERAEVIKGAFELMDKKAVKGKRVLLVDDVFTTGATADECARVLKKGGAAWVAVLTFASGAIKVPIV